jgi:Predicted membrane protein (DUF2243)
MTWDGLFHALTWVITLVGILQLRSAAYARDPVPSAQAFTGQLILGWGIFNLVEGVIDHQILGLHNVREVPNYTVYNLTFLAVGGVLFIPLGWLLMRAGSRVGAEVRAGNVYVIDVTARKRGGLFRPAPQLLWLRRLLNLDALHPMRLPPGVDIRHVERLDIIDDLPPQPFHQRFQPLAHDLDRHVSEPER